MSLSLLLTVIVNLATLYEFDTSEKVWRGKKEFSHYASSCITSYLCCDVVSLPVPLEGGQGVAMVGVAGEGELVPLPQGVRRQAGDARGLGGSEDLDRF